MEPIYFLDTTLSIQTAFFSKMTQQIHIVLYNSNPDQWPYEQIITNIFLKKETESGHLEFDCMNVAQFTYFDPILPEATTGYTQAHIIIPLQDITSYVEGGKDFDIKGITSIEVETSANTLVSDLKRTIWDPSDLYKYKTAIIDSEEARGGAVRAAKKLARFSFYEQMLVSAAEQGFNEDATIYYNELVRMATYNTQTVKQEQAFL